MKNITMLLILAGSLLFNEQLIEAQSSVSGTIKDSSGNPLQAVNVMILHATDSILISAMLTNSTGTYTIENLSKGTYILSASFSGMKNYYSEPFELTGEKKDFSRATIYLQNHVRQLSDVTVIARKPSFEQKIDRMVMQVKNSPVNTGSTALEVLGKSPGVTINRQNSSITVNGKTGVLVMINGKINYMPSEAIFQLLASISSDNIEKIEVITTPPSKYDAEGMAGYINIVLINNPNTGINGSYFITAGYGKKEWGDAGFNANFRNSKISLNGNYSFTHSHYIQPSTAITLFRRGTDTISNASFSNRDALRDVHDIRLDVEYHKDSSNIFGLILGANFSNWKMHALNGTRINKNNAPDTTINTFNKERNNWQNSIANLNFQHTFKTGKYLNIEANYINYKNINPNAYINQYYNPSNEIVRSEDLESWKETPILIKVASIDYTTPIREKIIVETGLKYSSSTFSNSAGLKRFNQGIYVTDSAHSAQYSLRENIGAAYTSCAIIASPKISIKAGLRFEITRSILTSNNTAKLVNRYYGAFFPTIFISKKLKGDQTINITYSRRITRPAFTDLAPFSIFFDPKTYFSGNAALQPAIANSIQAGYAIKKYNFTISYTHEENTIENFYFQTQKIDTITNILYLSARNFKHEKYLTASVSLPINLTTRWSMQNNLNLNLKQIQVNKEAHPNTINTSDFNISSIQRMVFSNILSFEITVRYYSKSYLGTTAFQPIYEIDAGIQMKFPNNKDIIRFNGNDIFNSGGSLRFSDHSIIGGDIRRNFSFGLVAYKIGYTHNFGNKALNIKKTRPGTAGEEMNRVRH